MVVLGTDHHPFDRLVRWADAWGAEHPQEHVVVQHGWSSGPRHVLGRDFFSHEELQVLLGAAAVVVCHGGPATIMGARRAGRVPLVVPRDPLRGEHVDHHQQLFTRRLAEDGRVVLCPEVSALDGAVERALAVPFSGVVDEESEEARLARAAHRVREVIDQVVDEGRRRR